MRRFRRTDEARPNPTSIIQFEPTWNNERTGSTSPLAYLFTYHEWIHGLGGLFAFECWLGRRLYRSTRMRLCMYRTACAQYRLCFTFCFLFSFVTISTWGSTSAEAERGGSIDGWCATGTYWNGVLLFSCCVCSAAASSLRIKPHPI